MSAEARRIAALVIAGLAVVGAAAEIFAVAVAIDRSPRTDAAEIDAPVVHISPSTPGRVVTVGVADNAAVKRGDVLFAVDPRPRSTPRSRKSTRAAATSPANAPTRLSPTSRSVARGKTSRSPSSRSTG